MQSCLSLENPSLFTVKSRGVLDGAEVPWEGQGYAEDAALAERGGFFDLSFWSCLEIAGPDAQDYLNRMTTVDFRADVPARVSPGAFLTGRGQVIAEGQFLRPSKDHGFFFILAGAQSEAAAVHLEKFHFAENLTVTDRSGQWSLFAGWNLTDEQLAGLGMAQNPTALERRERTGEIGGTYWWDEVQKPLVWVWLPRAAGRHWLQELRAHAVPLLGQRLFEYYRLDAGIPKFGAEVSEKDLVLEAGMERVVARNKGCYPGQEVVERIFTYGQVNRKLLRVTVAGELGGQKFPIPIFIDDKQVAVLVSAAQVPQNPKTAVGLAYVQRLHWDRADAFPETSGLRVQIRRT